MKTRTYPRALLSAMIVMGWMWLTAAECGFTITPVHWFTCDWTRDTDFPSAGVLDLDKPARCPIAITGPINIPYAATLQLASNLVVPPAFQAQVTDFDGITRAMAAQAFWSDGSGGSYFVNVDGNYTAGLGGFDVQGQGYDEIRNSFRSASSGNLTSATIRIAYVNAPPSNHIGAPSAVDPYATYTVWAETNDPLLVSPLTWEWYVDGVLAGTTSVAEFTVQAGAPNATQQISASARDAYGHSAYGSTFVWARLTCYDVNGNPTPNCQ